MPQQNLTLPDYCFSTKLSFYCTFIAGSNLLDEVSNIQIYEVCTSRFLCTLLKLIPILEVGKSEKNGTNITNFMMQHLV